jgi:hypothetical protein
MTDEQGPFLMQVDMVFKLLKMPVGISQMALSQVTSTVAQFNKSLFLARAHIETMTFPWPGRAERFLDPGSMLFCDFSRINEQENDRFESACSAAMVALRTIQGEVSDKDVELIGLLLTELDSRRNHIFTVEIADQSHVVPLGSLISKKS